MLTPTSEGLHRAASRPATAAKHESVRASSRDGLQLALALCLLIQPHMQPQISHAPHYPGSVHTCWSSVLLELSIASNEWNAGNNSPNTKLQAQHIACSDCMQGVTQRDDWLLSCTAVWTGSSPEGLMQLTRIV